MDLQEKDTYTQSIRNESVSETIQLEKPKPKYIGNVKAQKKRNKEVGKPKPKYIGNVKARKRRNKEVGKYS